MDDGVPSRKRRVTLEQRRALQLLACSPCGATAVLMLAQGFTRRRLVGLVRAELATARHSREESSLHGNGLFTLQWSRRNRRPALSHAQRAPRMASVYNYDKEYDK